MVTQPESSLKLDRTAWGVVLTTLIALVVGVYVARSATIVLDSRQILYRYAEQVHAGNGLVFNPSERVLLLPSPIEMILLAAFSTVFSIETASMILFAVAGIIGNYSLFRIAQRAGFSVLAAGLVAVLFSCMLSLLHVADETLPLAAAMSLLALKFALEDHWTWSGITLTIAVLCNPEALTLAPALLILAGD